MKQITGYISDLYLSHRFYWSMTLFVILFVVSFFVPVLLDVIASLFIFFLLVVIGDYIFLFSQRMPTAKRTTPDRYSNGDANKVELTIHNKARTTLTIDVLDEIPDQFEARDFALSLKLRPKEHKHLSYVLRPVIRGEYSFGNLNLYCRSGAGLIIRRHIIDAEEDVQVYPSFLNVKNYQLQTRDTRLNEQGSKRMRKLGHSMEFEQIKDYVSGDDIRSLNWKASARRGLLMVNNFTEERSQQVYCIIDKGRLMKMPFNGLTLLDHSINSVLMMANVCLQRNDKVGLITFSDKPGTLLAADRKKVQREKIFQALYKEQTGFLESDFELLYSLVRYKITNRSLLILYTNFESLDSLERQLPYLRAMSKYHLLVVVFFENTEVVKLSQGEAHSVEDVYIRTIAEKFVFEKRLIAKELNKYGILTVLTSPQDLSVKAINKYLELKIRQAW